MFPSGGDPGPSFVDLMRGAGGPQRARRGGEAVGGLRGAPPAAGARPERLALDGGRPGVWHGTTIVALRSVGGVVVAGDRRATEGHTIAHRGIEKVFPADRHSAVAIAGAAGPAIEMVRLFQTQLEHYEKVEGSTLSLEGKANQLAQMVRGNLPMAMEGLAVLPAVRRLRPPPANRPHLLLRPHRRSLRGDSSTTPPARAGGTPRRR